MYKRVLYGDIFLSEKELRKNEIFYDIKLEYYKIRNESIRENKMYRNRNSKKGIYK